MMHGKAVKIADKYLIEINRAVDNLNSADKEEEKKNKKKGKKLWWLSVIVNMKIFGLFKFNYGKVERLKEGLWDLF